jgi:hypothetical protein
MRLRRASFASLIVALLALSGATVAPTRGLGGTNAPSIVWQARDERQAPVAQKAGSRHRAGRYVGRTESGSAGRPGVPQSPVRHALFQRPPPASSSIAS